MDVCYIVARNLFNVSLPSFEGPCSVELEENLYGIFNSPEVFPVNKFSSQLAVGYVLRRRNRVRFNTPSICAYRRTGKR